MANVFHHSANYIARGSIVLVVLLGLGVAAAGAAFFNSSLVTGVEHVREQPVPFSHQHHVGGLGIDCRYCHTSVEKEAFAGIPPTRTCMTCHSQIWTNAPLLAPVRESFATDRSLEWTRVHDLPDFAYFNHSIHVAKGVGCSTCHGRMDQMQLTFKNASLYMQWCIACHKAPEKNLRPLDQIFNMEWEPPSDQLARGAELRKQYNLLPTQQLISCSTCHR